MKTKILILAATAMMYSVALFSQRDETTGHTTTWKAFYTAFFGGQKNDGTLSNELWITYNDDYVNFIKIEADGVVPPARKNHIAWENPANGNLLIEGGEDANGNCLSDIWEFNFDTRKWTLIEASLPICGSKQTAVKTNDRVYIAGGQNSSGASLSYFGSFDLNNVSSGYTPKADLIEPLAGTASFTKGGNIYLYGGKNHDWDPNTPGNQPSYSQNIWKYNIANDSWTLQTTSKSQIIELTEMAYTQDTLENFFYVFGGKTYDYGTNTELYSNEIYKLDLNTFSWTKLTNTLPYGLAGFTATYKHGTNFNTDTIFLLGGQTSSGTISTNLFKFIPSKGELITVPLVTSNMYTTQNLQLYPNPASDFLFVKNADRNSIVTIYDIKGIQIIQCNLQNEQINISELPKGFYTIRIKSENIEIINKFVKQ